LRANGNRGPHPARQQDFGLVRFLRPVISSSRFARSRRVSPQVRATRPLRDAGQIFSSRCQGTHDRPMPSRISFMRTGAALRVVEPASPSRSAKGARTDNF